eukprot:RCo054907
MLLERSRSFRGKISVGGTTQFSAQAALAFVSRFPCIWACVVSPQLPEFLQVPWSTVSRALLFVLVEDMHVVPALVSAFVLIYISCLEVPVLHWFLGSSIQQVTN